MYIYHALRCFYLGEKYISDLVIDASERFRVLNVALAAYVLVLINGRFCLAVQLQVTKKEKLK